MVTPMEKIAIACARRENGYPRVRSRFGQSFVISDQSGELRAEQPRCRQVDRIQGAQQPIGLDDGGADHILVDLDVLERVEQPLCIRDQRGPSARHGPADFDPEQVRADPVVASVLAVEGEKRLGVLLGR